MFIDAARFIAAMLVVIGHARSLLISDYSPGGFIKAGFYFVTSLGHQAVMAFFVISGYCIASSIARRLERWNLADYLLDRVIRLWVVLIPALILTAVLDHFGGDIAPMLYDGRQGNHVIQSAVSDRGAVAVGNALFFQTLLVPTFGTNGALWSLANEFWYYLWLPALLMFARRLPMLWPFTVALAVGIAFPALLPGFGVWLLGAIAFIALPRRPARVERAPLISRLGARCSYSIYAAHLPILVFATAFIAPTTRLPYGAESVSIVLGVTLGAIILGFAFSLLTELHTGTIRQRLHGLRGAIQFRANETDNHPVRSYRDLE